MGSRVDMGKELINFGSEVKLLLSEANENLLETLSRRWRTRVLGHGASSTRAPNCNTSFEALATSKKGRGKKCSERQVIVYSFH